MISILLFRLVIGTWMLSCLLISASYAGTLRSHYTNPVFSKPIKTPADIVNSGLSWSMVMIGAEEEQFMQESTDPVIQTIWRNMITDPFAGGNTNVCIALETSPYWPIIL